MKKVDVKFNLSLRGERIRINMEPDVLAKVGEFKFRCALEDEEKKSHQSMNVFFSIQISPL